MRSTYKFHENGATTKSNDPTVYKKDYEALFQKFFKLPVEKSYTFIHEEKHFCNNVYYKNIF